MVNVRWVLVGCGLLVTACAGPGTGAPGPLPLPAAQTVSGVSGVVVENASTDAGIVPGAWTGGAGAVTGQIVVGSGAAAVKEVLVTGDLAADGSFALALPDAVDGARLHAFTDAYFQVGSPTAVDGDTTACSGAPTLSTSSALGVTLLLNVKAGQSGSLTPVLAGAAAQGALQLGSVVYVDSPLTVTGRVTCTSTYSGAKVTGTVTYNLNLARGWNELTISESNGGQWPGGGVAALDITLSSGALPTNQWLFSPFTAVVPVRPDSLRGPLPAR